jgi:hypothetical protein
MPEKKKGKHSHHYVSLFDFLCDELVFRVTDADFLKESYPPIVRSKFKPVYLERLNFLRSIGIQGEPLKKLIRFFPQILFSDLKKKFLEIQRVYGVSRARVVKAVLSFPPFAGYDHNRVLGELEQVYGVSRERAVKAVLSFPPFAGLNHERVLRNLVKRGRRYAGLTEQEVKRLIVENPFLAAYKEKRLDSFMEIVYVHRNRLREGVSLKEVREWVLERPRELFSSPYVVVELEDGSVKKMGYRKAMRLIERKKATQVKEPVFLKKFEQKFVFPFKPREKPKKPKR